MKKLKEKIKTFLISNNLNYFDLGIYDRVLYLLGKDKVLKHFELYGKW
jgi:hypothetical protein